MPPNAYDLTSPLILSQTPLFKDMTPEEVDLLRQLMEVVNLKQGDVLLRENQICTPDLYLLMDGTMEVREGGMTLARREPYAILGELAFVVEHPRSASVAAATDCMLLRLDATEVRAQLASHPALSLKLMEAVARLIAERFLEMDRRTRELLKEAPPELREKYSRTAASSSQTTSP